MISNYKDFIIGKFHPSDIINILEHFVMGIDMEVGVIFKSEFLFFQYVPIYFNLLVLFPQQFPEDSIISF